MHSFRIGESPARIEDDRMLRGQGRFTDDLHLPGQLHLHVLRSPHAHARIGAIDVSAALDAPGVMAIASAEDLQRDGVGQFSVMLRHRNRAGEPMFVPPRLPLARQSVHHVGEPVLAVFAQTREQAQDAAELCEIDYEPLEAVADLADACAQGAAPVWPEAADNEAFRVLLGRQEAVDGIIARSARVASLRLRIPRLSANPIETRCAVAVWNDFDRRFTLYAGTHTPHSARQDLAGVLGIDPGMLRVVAPDLGGSFGMKDGGYPEYAIALWGARRLGRPVRWVCSRSEALQSDFHGRDNLTSVDLALDDEGCFTALRVRTAANIGAYFSFAGPFVPVANVGGVAGVYRTPEISAEIRGIFTNTGPTAPYRGAGCPEATYVLERVIDAAAAEFGFDRVELRRKNLIAADQMPFRTGLTFEYDCGDFAAGMDKALEAAGCDGFEARRAEARLRNRFRGLGICNSIEIAGGPPGRPFPEEADLRFAPDGSATVVVGTKSHGQGHETSYAQLMVERFGMSPERVRLVTGDTDLLSFGRGTFGSRTMSAGGTAVMAAGDRIMEKARQVAARELQADENELVFADGAFSVRDTNRYIDFAEVCRICHDERAMPAGAELGLSARVRVSAQGPTFPNGCHVCELEVDPETGAVEIVSYLLVDDVGTVINPMMVEGQLHGGIAQGLGEAMMEELIYERGSGQLLSGSFQDYAMPRAGDLPWFGTLSNPVPTKMNPLGVKGVGEAGAVGAPAAFVNAVIDALRPLGVRHIDMPLSPSTVWQAIREAARK